MTTQTTTAIKAASSPNDQNTWYDWLLSWQGDFLGNQNTVAEVSFTIVGTTADGHSFTWTVDTSKYPSPTGTTDAVVHTEQIGAFSLTLMSNEKTGLI